MKIDGLRRSVLEALNNNEILLKKGKSSSKTYTLNDTNTLGYSVYFNFYESSSSYGVTVICTIEKIIIKVNKCHKDNNLFRLFLDTIVSALSKKLKNLDIPIILFERVFPSEDSLLEYLYKDDICYVVDIEYKSNLKNVIVKYLEGMRVE